MPTVYDLKQFRSPDMFSKFCELLEEIKNSDDRNRQNYLGLERQIENYDCFHIVVVGNEIKAFSALQSFGYPKGHSRALTRTYYHPQARRKNLVAARSPSFATIFMLGSQIEMAKRLKKSIVFVSVEMLRRRAFLREWTKYVNSLNDYQWAMAEGMYLTCPAAESRNCWQNISYLRLNPEADLALPKMSCNEWIKRFGGKFNHS